MAIRLRWRGGDGVMVAISNQRKKVGQKPVLAHSVKAKMNRCQCGVEVQAENRICGS